MNKFSPGAIRTRRYRLKLRRKTIVDERKAFEGPMDVSGINVAINKKLREFNKKIQAVDELIRDLDS